jgi:5-methylthioadenosine/S-adenosylhomocysteine deaminase
MKKLINAKILTPEYTIIDGEVLLKDDRIAEVAAKVDVTEFTDVEVIDCQNNLLIPGLVNAHTHSAMTFLRSRADDLPLQEWLEDVIFPNEAKLTPEDVYWFAQLAILDYISGGTTCALDMYLNNAATSQAALDMGFRMTLVGSLNDFGGTVADLQADFEQLNKPNSRVQFVLGIHAEYTTNPALIREVADLAHSLQAPTYTHLAETRREVDDCISRTGKTSVQHLADCGFWEFGGAGFHSVHLTDEDRALMQKLNVTAVSCPGSNLKLASGVADLEKLNQAGVNVALGTDGPASNNALSMFREMFLASTLQKVKHNDASRQIPEQILQYATANGATAARIDAGAIAEGKLADLALINLNSPNMLLNNPVKNLVYSTDKADVLLTIINGEVRYNRGEYILPSGRTAEQIYAECGKRVERMVQ